MGRTPYSANWHVTFGPSARLPLWNTQIGGQGPRLPMGEVPAPLCSGFDLIVLYATNAVTGETCLGHILVTGSH